MEMMIQSDSIELKESYNSHLSVFAKENIDSSTLSLPLPLSSKKFTTSTTNTQSSSCNVATNKADIINSPIINVYMIYFGYSSSDYFENSKSINSTASIIQRYIENVGGSTYSNMLTNFQVTNQMAYKGSAFLWNRNMTALTDSAVTNLIGQAITQNKWTVESNAIYQFIFRGDITYKSNTLYGQGWGSYWCGFHSSATFNNQNYLYSVVGDVKFASPDVQIGCFAGIYLGYANKKVFTWSGAAPHPAPQSMNNSAVSKHIQPYFGNYFVSPNHNMFADAIIYTMSHELFETATNPRGQGYYSVAGSCAGDEIGDMCSATYGYINQDPTTGVNYNLVLGSDKFMVQTIWQAPGTSHCALNSTAVPLVFASVSASPSQDTAVGFNFSTLSTPTLIGVCAGISVGGLALIVSVVYLLFRYRICCSSASWRVSSDKVVLSGKAKTSTIEASL